MRNGITYIVPSGLASFPHDFAIIDVFADRLEAKMSSVPESLAEPYASNLHGMRRHGIDFVDAQHSTNALYCGGNPEERSVTVTRLGRPSAALAADARQTS